MTLNQLQKKISEANKAYREGNHIISDYEFDQLVDELTELNPNDPLLLQIGFMEEKASRKDKLPIPMYSLNKVKTVDEIKSWMASKIIHSQKLLVLTPKYDGASLLAEESKRKAWTRGDGITGQRSDEHFKILVRNSGRPSTKVYTVGEVILPTKNWKKWSDKYSNPRNMITGKLNTDVPEIELEDAEYVRYGVTNDQWSKMEQLDFCNSLNTVKVPYIALISDKLTEEYLKNLYIEWSKEFSIDGIVIEVNDAKTRQELGRERNGNPCYARAYKGNFEEVKRTVVKSIEWTTSKHGLIKPVGVVEPVVLDGAIVSRVTLYNAKYVKSMGIGKGASIEIKRSGQVIPFVVSVITKSNGTLPPVCLDCGSTLEWSKNTVDLVCENDECPAQAFKKIVAFFSILGVEEVSEGILATVCNSGFDTVKKILSMKEKDFRTLEGFGDRKSEVVYNNIQAKLKNIDLSTLQHASGCFVGLGSRKLKLLEDFYDKTPTIAEISSIEGFAETSAIAYLKGMKQFREFIKNLPITLKKKEALSSTKYKGMVFVFTGYRDKEAENGITSNGGKIGSSVSKTTTYLITKEKGSGSSKETKAQELGVKIFDAEKFNEFMKD